MPTFMEQCDSGRLALIRRCQHFLLPQSPQLKGLFASILLVWDMAYKYHIDWLIYQPNRINFKNCFIGDCVWHVVLIVWFNKKSNDLNFNDLKVLGSINFLNFHEISWVFIFFVFIYVWIFETRKKFNNFKKWLFEYIKLAAHFRAKKKKNTKWTKKKPIHTIRKCTNIGQRQQKVWKMVLDGCNVSHHNERVHHKCLLTDKAANSFSAIASRIDVLSINSDMWIAICWIEKECYLADASNQYIRTGIHLCVKFIPFTLIHSVRSCVQVAFFVQFFDGT